MSSTASVDAVERDRVRRILACELGIAHGVVVAAHVVHPVAEPPVAGEERLVLLGPAGVGEIALDHDDVGIEREHLVDDRAVHQLRVRRRAGATRSTGPIASVAGSPVLPALGLAEVHVVGGGDGGEQSTARACQRAHAAPGSHCVGRRALDLEGVVGVGLEPGDPRVVERARSS